MGENYASMDQMKLVGLSCYEYDQREELTSNTLVNVGRSCATCDHWTGKECDIDVFDKVLTGLDQE
jgi:hypothetical protein